MQQFHATRLLEAGPRLAVLQGPEAAEAGALITITDADFEAGFSTQSDFNRTFRQETGMTPREYRKIAKIRTTSRSVAASGEA